MIYTLRAAGDSQPKKMLSIFIYSRSVARISVKYTVPWYKPRRPKHTYKLTCKSRTSDRMFVISSPLHPARLCLSGRVGASCSWPQFRLRLSFLFPISLQVCTVSPPFPPPPSPPRCNVSNLCGAYSIQRIFDRASNHEEGNCVIKPADSELPWSS